MVPILTTDHFAGSLLPKFGSNTKFLLDTSAIQKAEPKIPRWICSLKIESPPEILPGSTYDPKLPKFGSNTK